MDTSTTEIVSPSDSLDVFVPLLDQIRVPNPLGDKIYKDECVYSFDSPESPDGLYICMKTFLGLGRKFVPFHHARTGSSVYLNMRRKKVPVQKDDKQTTDDHKAKITKLAINVEGGFQTDCGNQIEEQEHNVIVIMPNFKEVSLAAPELPDKIVMAVSAIMSADSASKKEELEVLSNTWDGEKRQTSKHSQTLVQMDNGVKVPPSGWKCEKCDIREGLWLNLTDGSIHCGRKYFDGTGGNNHASEHYEATKYPLVVKLGTITPNGADVYSYDEDAMVENPNLDKHLAHFGINISDCKKTEKSMIEMEIDLNKRLDEWSIIQEDGFELRPIFGPGFTGIANLGNSCYLNSVMQMLFSIPEFITEYYRQDKEVQYSESNHHDPAGDLRTQLMKLAAGLLSGEYSLFSHNMKEQIGIRPQMFKNLIGRGHPEFMSKRQQDAQEFLLYVLEQIEKMHQGGQLTSSSRPPPGECFKFEIEQRVQCGESSKVKYSTRCESHLSLPVTEVPIQNKEEYEQFLALKAESEKNGIKLESNQTVHPIIKMMDCLEKFANEVRIDDFFSSAVNRKTFATMTSRFRTFPDYLLIHLKKFTLNENWVPIKLDVSMDVPDFLDINNLRARGKQPNEEELPETNESSSGNTSQPAPAGPATQPGTNQFVFNEDYLLQMSEMGFPVEGCKRALYHTKNQGVEQATSWLVEHFEDPNITDPFVVPTQESSDGDVKTPAFQVDPEALRNLQDMGIPERQSYLALKLNNNNAQRAIEWYFSNEHRIDEVEREEMEQERQQRPQPQEQSSNVNHDPVERAVRDGPGRYELVGLISHMGTSTFCGHYVAHLKKPIPATGGGAALAETENANVMPAASPPSETHQWVIFNDNKVAISERPPKQFAYIYLYRRCTQ